MSSAERENALAGELIERLLVDPQFRAEFRRDPAAACLAAGLPDLAEELGASAGSIDALAVRESRSSLAGVVMAVAVEGMSFAEAQTLMHHGLSGMPRGVGKLPHAGSLHRPLGHLPHAAALHHAASPTGLERELRGLHAVSGGRGAAAAEHAAGAPAEPASAPAAGSSALSASPAPAAAAPATAASASPSPAAADVPAASAPSTPGAAPAGVPAAPPEAAGVAAAPPEPAGATPAPPVPGAQPAHGGVVPAWPDQPAPGSAGATDAPAAGAPAAASGVAPVGAAEGYGGAVGTNALVGVLESPRLAAPPGVRAFLSAGGADPRLVAVLDSALANHSIGLGQVTALSDPVHVQAISIVSVDGQPVGPGNFAARDLVTEIAALDPTLRPTEIGTPWPIHAAGFYSDHTQQAQLHLAFVSSADYAPPSGNAAGLASAAPAPAGGVAAAVETPAPAATVAPAVETPASTGAVAPAVEAPASAAPAAAATAPDGQYVNPLPDSAHIGRTDMGVDANMNPGDPIVAPGASRVLGITPDWYRGQPYVALQLLDGPMKGHNYYLAEQITLNVSVGQVVQQGQPIAHYAASGTGIEMGWAGPNWAQTLAQATSGYSEGEQTHAGASFRDFLDSLGHHGTPASSASDAVPDPDASAGPDPDASAGPDPDATAGPAPDATGGPAPDVTAGSAPQAAAGPAPDVVAGAPPAAAADQAGPQPFTVLEPHHHGARSHTVQFLPAVQPAPGSPLYDQAAAPAPSSAAGVAPATAPGAVAPTTEAVAPAAEPTSPGALIDQAPAPAPSGGAISVTSSLLTAGQAKFAGRLAELTGLDPRVVAAWELAEESGGAAQAREAASNFNWLNIGYFDSGAGKIAFDKTFSDPISAAEQSAKFLKGEWGGASPSIRAILNAVGHSPDEQMSAIANSDWASSHYGGGANLHGTYNELEDIHIEKSTLT